MKRLPALFLLTAFLVCPAAHADDVDTPADTQRQQAANLFRKGDYPQAIALYRDLAKADPSNLEAQKDLMWVLWNTGAFEEAGREADRILQNHPNDEEAKGISSRSYLTAKRPEILELRKKAAAQMRAGQYAAAVKTFNEVLAIDPGNYRLLKDAMWANTRAGNKKEALALAHRVLAIYPEDADALELVNRSLGKTNVAEQKNLPLTARIRILALRAREGRTQEAVDGLEQLARENPKNTDVLRYLTSICHKAGRFKQGLHAAERWTALAPKDPHSWFWLGVLQLDNGDMAAAQAAYERSLALDPDQPRAQLAIARFYIGAREFPTAIAYLEKAQKGDPRLKEVYPHLAKATYWTQQYDRSAGLWKQAIEAFPDRNEYRFNEAQALYYAGRRPEALEKLRAISADPDETTAFLFLVDDALIHQDDPTAIRLLEERLKTVKPSDEALVIKLGDLYTARQSTAAAAALMDRFLAAQPHSSSALNSKANTLYAEKDFKGSAAAYKKILEANPNDVDALQSLAACESARGNRRAARKLLERLEAVDPTHPAYIRLAAQGYYDEGFKKDAKKKLEDWLQANSTSPVLTVLLYHGLTPFPKDPVLVYPSHVTTTAFESQIKTLLAAGYKPVTTDQAAQWIRRQGTLPPHPLLITFDDARLDSVLYGDPVLEKTGARASMFTPIVNVDGARPAGYLPWSRLKTAQRSGRWEVESHGGDAHNHIPIDAAGSDGLFLVNRAWNSEDKRLETEDEWHQRIAADYRSSRDKILRQIGTAPAAYAYPEGIYGQEGVVNTPKALTANLALAATTYQTAYIQDPSGVNLLSRDPYRLNRLEPSNAWSGERLLQHLRDNDPRVMMIGQQLDWALLEGRLADAKAHLEQLKSYQISDGLRLSKEAAIAFASGDPAAGKKLAEQALTFGPFPDLRRNLADAQAEDGWSWDPSITFGEDSANRRSFLFEQALRTRRYANWRLGLRHQWGWYRDDAAGRIDNTGLGLEAQYYIGSRHRLTAVAMGQILSSPSETMFSGSGTWDALWSAALRSRLSGGQRFVPTASAMAAEINDRYVKGGALWDIDDRWRAATDNRFSSFTDGNTRVSTVDEISRLFWTPANLRGVYQFTYDDMKNLRPEYYSPQSLIMNGVGPDFWVPLGSGTRWWTRYLLSYADEANAPGEWDHMVDTRLRINWGKNSLEPEFIYYQTPTYHSYLYRLEFVHYF